MRTDRASRKGWGMGGLEASGTLNSAGPLIVRVRTEGLGGGRRWSVGLGGEGAIVGDRWCRGECSGSFGEVLGMEIGRSV